MRIAYARTIAVVLFATLGPGVADARGQTASARTDQNRPDPQAPPSWIDRIAAIADPGSTRRVRPIAGLVVPGSGLSGGVEIELPRIGGTALGAGGDAMISIHNYQQLTLRAGWLARRRALTTLRTFDAPLASLLDAPASPARGAAVFVEHRYRRLPTLALFGELDDTLPESDFGRTSTATDVVVQWNPSRTVGLGGRVGFLSTELFPGTADNRPDTDALFGAGLGYDHVADARYVVSSVGVLWDRRNDPNRPARGAMLQAGSWIFRPASGTLPAFTRTAVDARVYRRLLHPRHIAAVRLVASMDDAAGEGRVPFHLQQTLGGAAIMRSFRSYRLRGERLASLVVESQWQAAAMLDIAAFVDSGVVGRAPLAHDARGVLTSVGVGARGRLRDRVVVRAEMAFGRDGGRFVFALDSPL